MDLLVSSSDRSSLSTSSSQFFVMIPGGVPVKEEGKIELLDVQLPNTLYNIVAGVNNVFVWNSASTNYAFLVPPGYYSVSQLANTLASSMNAADSNGYSWTYSNQTMKFSVSGTAAFTINWVSNPNSSPVVQGMARVLGFAFQDTISATSFTGNYVSQLQGPEKLLLVISEFTYQGKTSSGIYYTFVINIDASSGYLNNIAENTSFDQKVRCPQMMISKLSVSLRYMNGTLADLGGADWNFLIRID